MASGFFAGCWRSHQVARDLFCRVTIMCLLALAKDSLAETDVGRLLVLSLGGEGSVLK